MYFLLAIVWAIVGVVLAIPYNWLSGGGGDFVPVVVVYGPPVALFLLTVFLVSKRMTNENGKRSFTFFWSLVALFNLPIILRFTSIGLKALKFKATADFIFKHRYESILVVFVVGFLILAAVGTIRGFVEKPTK
jgi:hypothetical protein